MGACKGCGKVFSVLDMKNGYCKSCSHLDTTHEKYWYYESGGNRLGPIDANDIHKMIEKKELNRMSLVWRKGMVDWSALNLIDEFKVLFSDSPPPLTSSAISNTIVWWLAFTPIIGMLLKEIISNEFNTDLDQLWWITLVLNILLSIWDEKYLENSGYDTSKMGGAWLVPIYLYKRAKVLKQNNAYFIIWLVSFFISLVR